MAREKRLQRHIQDIPTIYLKPGEIHFGHDPVRVITVLGSCVSVIMYHRLKRIGAMCHAVMPACDEVRGKSSSSRQVFQYVDYSVRWMLEQFEKSGIRKGEIEVKIFGGAEMFMEKEKILSVGKRNIEAAMKLIREQNLKLKAWNVGGNNGRKVVFYTDTGDVYARTVERGGA